jgi:hypothetical protein
VADDARAETVLVAHHRFRWKFQVPHDPDEGERPQDVECGVVFPPFEPLSQLL